MTETRTVDPTTGGEKGVKGAAFHLIPAGPLWELAELYGRGALKYSSRNWEKGYAWSKSFAAMMRHAWLFWKGEDVDTETGRPHLASVAWHAFALMEWAATHPELDDRPGHTSADYGKAVADLKAELRKQMDSSQYAIGGIINPPQNYYVGDIVNTNGAAAVTTVDNIEHHRPGDCPACEPHR